MNFRMSGLCPTIFSHLFGQPDDALANLNVIRYTADAEHAFPCRVTLQDAAIGDSLLLVNHEHQPAKNAYQSRHAVYVNEAAVSAGIFENAVPMQMQRRLLSIRAFDACHMMIDAEVIDGINAEVIIQRLLNVEETAYLHVHFARRGCFAARVDRINSK